MYDRALDAILGSPEQVDAAFDSLMPRRVNNLLLVTSLYDCYTFIEDGRLSEMLFSEYLELNLRFAPSIERVSTAQEALQKIQAESYDLIISMPRLGDMDVRDFGRAVREIAPALPVVLLASSTRELCMLQEFDSLPGIDRVFVWLGDVRLFLAIIKHIEDRENAWHDARTAGVKCILLIEDSVQFYSSYLPLLYTEIMKQTQTLMADGVNRMQKMMRQRARPKILLANTYEEAVRLYERYRDDLLGVILDAFFLRCGKVDRTAGTDFVRLVKSKNPGIPVVIQSKSENASIATDVGVQFIDKNSPSLLHDLRKFMQNHLGFGDFVFKRPDGRLVSRAGDLRNLEWALQAIPEDCLMYHVRRNDLAIWLMARTEFTLADVVRSISQDRDHSPAEMRRQLLNALALQRQRNRAGVVADFSSGTFEGDSGFVRIGAGSLGGKGRGLAFTNALINKYKFAERFPGVRIFVPPTAVLATGVFDQFMENSGLSSFALHVKDDERIAKAFWDAEFPPEVMENLWTFLDWVRYPLAVRSSSLLEDASFQPFAGIYETYFIPNNNESTEVRLEELCNAIKMVYASTYYADAKAYIESTANRLEEEKMAVIIQQVVGQKHGNYFYPNVAGVARSMNYYPMPGMKAEDGVASVVLGLGKAVVEGGRCVRFCPVHPRKPMQYLTVEEYLDNAQSSFYALDLSLSGPRTGVSFPGAGTVALELDQAEAHGTLAPVGSVYSPDNDAIYDGISRQGVRLVTMAGMLKGGVFPLGDVLAFMLEVGEAGSSCPVEIEFAVNLNSRAQPHEFGFLQIRPMVHGSDSQDIQLDQIKSSDVLCLAHQALGNGYLPGVQDIIYVCPEKFDRAQTRRIAHEIGTMNAALKSANRPYLLIGPGRWGSLDSWLGIPVKWSEISGVRCIIETNLADMHVDPSQGSHFFHNITSFNIGYLTIDKNKEDVLDLSLLDALPAESETEHLRHISLGEPLEIALNSRRNYGVVMKPGKSVK